MTSVSEQHLPYRSTADVVVLDGDGSRWVREMACHLVEDEEGRTACSECGCLMAHPSGSATSARIAARPSRAGRSCRMLLAMTFRLRFLSDSVPTAVPRS